MITKYTEYIKDNNSLIHECIDELNNSFYKKYDNFFKIEFYINHIKIINNITSSEIFKIYILANGIKLERYKDVIMFDIDKNIKQTLKSKIILIFIIDLFNNLMHDHTLILTFNLNSNIEEVLDYILSNIKLTSLFIDLLKEKYLPLDIIEKYKYLLDAKNFDLI